MKQNNPLRLLVILSLAAIALTANAKLDKKYYDKVAKEVWAEELPMFNPKADLSDSLYQNRSAVIIGHYIGLKEQPATSWLCVGQRLAGRMRKMTLQ